MPISMRHLCVGLFSSRRQATVGLHRFGALTDPDRRVSHLDRADLIIKFVMVEAVFPRRPSDKGP